MRKRIVAVVSAGAMIASQFMVSTELFAAEIIDIQTEEVFDTEADEILEEEADTSTEVFAGTTEDFVITEQEKIVRAAVYLDVKSGDWFYGAVNYVTANGIMKGYANGSFGPADALGRGQFATILHRVVGSPEMEFENIFSDVLAGQFYSLSVIWAQKNKIITGYENGKFGPLDSITREQLATMLYRHAELKGSDVTARKNLDIFPDGGKVAGFAKETMSWAVAEGIITGDQGKLNPQGISSRAVAATMMQRFQTKRMGGK